MGFHGQQLLLHLHRMVEALQGLDLLGQLACLVFAQLRDLAQPVPQALHFSALEGQGVSDTAACKSSRGGANEKASDAASTCVTDTLHKDCSCPHASAMA